MNKSELVAAIAEKSGLTKADSKKAPSTKTAIEIPAKKVAKFKAGAELADAIA